MTSCYVEPVFFLSFKIKIVETFVRTYVYGTYVFVYSSTFRFSLTDSSGIISSKFHDDPVIVRTVKFVTEYTYSVN